ncbi:tether containing UBX domain for GLUT4 [Gastrophryne carolinensis]
MAASGAVVSVLAPNGRRQVVKVTAGTPLLQVLEEVCRKHNFNPREYNLKFQRTVLDLSLQWRFANLPNNAKLEMVSCSQQRAGAEASKVRVALQLEDGARLQDEFQCGKTLWDVVAHFPQTRVCLEEVPPGNVAVCIYMRDEVSGEHNLKKTTLLSLGLTGGSAIIRFVVRKCDLSENRQSSCVQKDTKTEDSEDKVADRALATETPRSKPNVCQEERLSYEATEKQPPPAATSTLQRVPPSEGEPQLPMDSVKPKSSDLSQPQPPSLASPFVPFQGGGHRLGGANASSQVDQQCATAQEPLHSPEHSKPKKSKTDKDANESEPLNREPIVCHMDLEQNVHAYTQELPDDFFEVTIDDVRRRFAELRNERHRLEEAPLMTKALREAQLKEKLERYPKVVLRVLFPDRYILQGFFQVMETLGAVVEFVRSYLEEPKTPFYLFITPPRTELKDESQTLFQAQLFPAAVIHFGSPQPRDHYLRQDLLRAPVSLTNADTVVARAIPRASSSSSPPPLIESFPDSSSEQPRRAPENYEEESGLSDSHQQAQRDVGKVPKWLKLPDDDDVYDTFGGRDSMEEGELFHDSYSSGERPSDFHSDLGSSSDEDTWLSDDTNRLLSAVFETLHIVPPKAAKKRQGELLHPDRKFKIKAIASTTILIAKDV